jgi:hypothetical protein
MAWVREVRAGAKKIRIASACARGATAAELPARARQRKLPSGAEPCVGGGGSRWGSHRAARHTLSAGPILRCPTPTACLGEAGYRVGEHRVRARAGVPAPGRR